MTELPLVYLVVDHYNTPYFKMLSKIHKRFFITNPLRFPPEIFKKYDVIVDNGVYARGRPSLSFCIKALKYGVPFILPDIIGNPEKTLYEHLRFIEFLEKHAPGLAKRVKSLGFVVLQGMKYEDFVRALELMEDHIDFKRVAIGGLAKRRKSRKKLVDMIALEVRKKYYVHTLGVACKHAHSFDSSWWGKRFLDQKLGRGHALEKIKRYIEMWENLENSKHLTRFFA